MAKESGNHKSSAELRTEVARSRQELSRDVARVRYELDLPAKVRRSFQRQPGAWIVGLAIAGLVGAAVLTRKRKVYVGTGKGAPAEKSKLLQAGFILGVLRIAANLCKPYIEEFVSQKIRSHGNKR
jgi:hypothetical protein